MSDAFTILVADRNPNVHALLKRELEFDGCRVRLAAGTDDLLEWAFRRDPPELIIMDPDLPGTPAPVLFALLRELRMGVRVVVHAHFNRSAPESAAIPADFIKVQKGAGSAEILKHVTRFILQTARGAGSQELLRARPEANR